MSTIIRFVCPLVALAVCGCASNKGQAMQIAISRGANNDSCLDGADIRPPSSESETTDIRVSVEVVTDGESGERTVAFECDAILPPRGDLPSVQIPTALGGRLINVHAEAFQKQDDGTFQRIATGSLSNLSLDPKTNPTTLPNLRMYRTERFSCLDQLSTVPRAFHSATKLPNGQVLLLGGIVDKAHTRDQEFGPLDPRELFPTEIAEVYDPALARFVTLDAPDLLRRAFHSALLLPTQEAGHFRILLLGGVTTTEANKPALGQTTSLFVYSRILGLIPQGITAVPADSLRPAPAEMLDYDVAQKTITRMTVDAWPALAFAAALSTSGGDVLMSSGAIFEAANDNAPAAATFSGQSNPITYKANNVATPVVFPGLGLRWAPSLTQVSSTSALLWGGGLPFVPPGPANAMPEGALVRFDGMGLTATAVGTTSTTKQLQFQSAIGFPAVGAGLPHVLVSGGFYGESAMPPNPPDPADAQSTSPPVEWIAVDTTNAALTRVPIALPSGHRATGWQSGVAVSRRRALLTGGAPKLEFCEGGPSLWCAVSQAALFDAETSVITEAEPMQFARLGHSSTVLNDGNVLLVGGVRRNGAGETQLIGNAEVFNPKLRAPTVLSSGVDPDEPLEGGLPATTMRKPGERITDEAGKPIASLQCKLLQ